MLEITDNDLPQANEENVSENASNLDKKPISEDTTADDALNPTEEKTVKSPKKKTKEKEVEKVATATDEQTSIAEEKEKEEEPKKPEEETKVEESKPAEIKLKGEKSEAFKTEDLEAMEPEELVELFSTTLKKESIQSAKPVVESIMKVFDKKMSALAQEKKEAFVASGENPDAFYFNPPIKKNYQELVRRYKSDRSTYYKSKEEQQKKNLAQRLELIEELKGLINVEQEIKESYKQFKDLQKRWKETGQVPRMQANNVWKTYHHHVGIFYDFLHLNRDLRELDFKFNLEQKLKICEQAEALASMEDISKAFRQLQTLHKKWKDELGPVDKEHSEEVWERFSNATKIIHDKRRYFLKNQDEVFEVNLIKKQSLIAQMHELLTQEFTEKTNIHNFSKTFESLKESFFEVGRVPSKKRDDLWAEFKKCSRAYNKKRAHYYKALKKTFAQNLAKKRALIETAEKLKDSENFSETTPKIIALQKQWKEIGPTHRKDTNKVWQEFRAICDEYFNGMHNQKNKNFEEEKENLSRKKSLLTAFQKSIEAAETKDAPLDVDGFINSWNSIGAVPRREAKIEHERNRIVEKAYKASGMSKTEIVQKSYQNKLATMQGNQEGVKKEIWSINRQMDELKQEIIQLETNLQFFGTNQDKNPIVIKVQEDIAKIQDRLDRLKEKKRLVKSIKTD
jgi:hypothetical protein